MPNVGINPNNKFGPTRNGELDMKNWNLDINPKLLNSPTLSPKLMNTAYHEARHAEQWFAAAQSQAAAPGATGPGVATAMGVPVAVGNAAKASPLAPNSSPRAVLGQAVNQSVYGSQRPKREAILKKLAAKRPPPNTYGRYRALPEEQDAWRTGDGTDACP